MPVFSILTAKAKASRVNKTGSWRTLTRPVFKHKDCINCGLCLLVCPESRIEGEVKNAYNPDYDYCKGCGLCAYICPKKDIDMLDEEQCKCQK